MPGDVSLEGSGEPEPGTRVVREEWVAQGQKKGKCRVDVKGEMAIRTGYQLHGVMLRGFMGREEDHSKVGARLLCMVVTTKERGVRRMRIAHRQRTLNSRLTVEALLDHAGESLRTDERERNGQRPNGK